MNFTMKRSALILAVLILCSLTVFAGNKNRIATAGAQELLIPVGARGIGLGGSMVASASGADAFYWNPAGVGRMMHSVDATFSYMNYLADIDVSYVGVAAKAGSIGTFGLSLKALNFGDIPVTTEDFPDGTGEMYSPTFTVLGITYANQVSDRISIGVTANLINETIMSLSAFGVAFDVGVQYSGLALPGLSLGVAVKNVGGQMKYDGANLYRQATSLEGRKPSGYYKVLAAPLDLPTSIEIGLSYQYKLTEENVFMVGGNFQNNNFQDDEYKVGAEYAFNNMFFVRGGYNLSPQAEEDPTGETSYIFGAHFGAGVNLETLGVPVRVDYAYRAVKYFDAQNVFTVSLAF